MQIIDMNDRNAATGLGSATIYLFLYFFQIILVVLLKVVMMLTGECFVKKNYFNKLIKNLFFNTLISLTMEGFLEFVVYAFLNIYTKDFTLNGEILGFIIAVFCAFCALIFLPAALIWALLTKNET